MEEKAPPPKRKRQSKKQADLENDKKVQPFDIIEITVLKDKINFIEAELAKRKKWLIGVELILPLTAAFLSIYIAFRGNNLLKEQNQLVQKQNIRLDQQTYLQESERRSSLVFLLGNILEAIDKELKDDVGKKQVRDLTPELIGRVVVLTHILRPYKFMDGDTLIERELSPEKGQLLISLLDSQIDTSSLSTIFDKGDFTKSFLRGVKLSNIWIEGINLNGSDLQDALFFDCSIANSQLSGIDFRGAYFTNCDFYKAVMWGGYFSKTNFDLCRLKSTYFDGSFLGDTDILRSTFWDCRFDRCAIKNCSFLHSKFTKVTLRGSNILDSYWFPDTLIEVLIDKKTFFDNLSFPRDYNLGLLLEGKDTVYHFVKK